MCLVRVLSGHLSLKRDREVIDELKDEMSRLKVHLALKEIEDDFFQFGSLNYI